MAEERQADPQPPARASPGSWDLGEWLLDWVDANGGAPVAAGHTRGAAEATGGGGFDSAAGPAGGAREDQPGVEPAADLGRAPPAVWIMDPALVCGPLTTAEAEAAGRAAAAEATRGLRPARGRRPHALFTIGAPGAGKTAAAAAYLRWSGRDPGPAQAGKEEEGGRASRYAAVDFDELVRFHPRVREALALPTMSGGPARVGLGPGWQRCAAALGEVADAVVGAVLGGGYDAVLQTHRHDQIAAALALGYEVTLLYVAAPVAVAQRRARDRAAATGRFLAATLADQDAYVALAWRRYRDAAPYWAQMCDEFAACDASGPAPARFEAADPHAGRAGRWRDGVARCAAVVDRAHADGRGNPALAAGR